MQASADAVGQRPLRGKEQCDSNTHTHISIYIYITYVFVFGSLNPQLSPEIAFVPAHPLELNMTTDCSI